MKIRIALAGELPDDQIIFGKVDLLVGQISGYLCRDNADADIQMLVSPSYTGETWLEWNKKHQFSMCTYNMRNSREYAEQCTQIIRKDTPLRNLLGEALCDKADALIVVWNEDVTQLSGATWELMKIAYDRKAPCIWVSTKSQQIYCLWESYYKKYIPQYLSAMSEPLPNGEPEPMEAKEKWSRFLAYWEKRRLSYLKKYKADTAVYASEEDGLMRQDFEMEEDASEGGNIRKILLSKFEEFDSAAIEWNSKFQAMLYQRSVLPFITTIFLAVAFYTETLVGKTMSEVFPGIGQVITALAAMLAGLGFLIHGLLNFYVYKMSKNKHIDEWRCEFLNNRYTAEILRVLIHFVPYGVELNLRKLCAKDRTRYMYIKHIADDEEPFEQEMNHKNALYVLKHAKEMLADQIAYHENSANRYKNIVASLEKWGQITFYIGFVVVLGRGGLQFILAALPIVMEKWEMHFYSGIDSSLIPAAWEDMKSAVMYWNNIARSFLNMVALLLPAWAGYFTAKVQQNNFRYNLDNHQKMISRLGIMKARVENVMEQGEIPMELFNIMVDELTETMLIDDTIGWQQQYMNSTVKPL